MIACFASLPKYFSAVSFIFVKTMEFTSSGALTLSAPLTLTLITGFAALVHNLEGQQLDVLLHRGRCLP